MMKKIIFIFITLLFSASSNAGTLCSMSISTDTTDLCTIQESGGEIFLITDTDDGNIGTWLFERNASFMNSFGIYNPYNPSQKLEIFAQSNTTVGLFANLSWDDGEFTSGSTTLDFGSGVIHFGVYSVTDAGTWYSESSLNGGVDHFLAFYTEHAGNYPFNQASVIFALDDQLGSPDRDYNDMITGCSNCKPVPEPGTLVLLSAALFGLILGRKKIF
ncbi:hypothetical protein A9Q98_15105 [Thalassotalea sp. 42_200_T64]|nr:hypothetical protein A9Q98_15105 [Thalassotalea sp. 42_200_T64]